MSTPGVGSSDSPETSQLLRLVVHFCSRKFMVVIRKSTTIKELKNEIAAIYEGTFCSASPAIAELQDFYGCTLFDGYAVSMVMRDFAEVFALKEGEQRNVPSTTPSTFFVPSMDLPSGLLASRSEVPHILTAPSPSNEVEKRVGGDTGAQLLIPSTFGAPKVQEWLSSLLPQTVVSSNTSQSYSEMGVTIAPQIRIQSSLSSQTVVATNTSLPLMTTSQQVDPSLVYGSPLSSFASQAVIPASTRVPPTVSPHQSVGLGLVSTALQAQESVVPSPTVNASPQLSDGVQIVTSTRSQQSSTTKDIASQGHSTTLSASVHSSDQVVSQDQSTIATGSSHTVAVDSAFESLNPDDGGTEILHSHSSRETDASTTTTTTVDNDFEVISVAKTATNITLAGDEESSEWSSGSIHVHGLSLVSGALQAQEPVVPSHQQSDGVELATSTRPQQPSTAKDVTQQGHSTSLSATALSSDQVVSQDQSTIATGFSQIATVDSAFQSLNPDDGVAETLHSHTSRETDAYTTTTAVETDSDVGSLAKNITLASDEESSEWSSDSIHVHELSLVSTALQAQLPVVQSPQQSDSVKLATSIRSQQPSKAKQQGHSTSLSASALSSDQVVSQNQSTIATGFSQIVAVDSAYQSLNPDDGGAKTLHSHTSREADAYITTTAIENDSEVRSLAKTATNITLASDEESSEWSSDSIHVHGPPVQKCKPGRKVSRQKSQTADSGNRRRVTTKADIKSSAVAKSIQSGKQGLTAKCQYKTPSTVHSSSSDDDDFDMGKNKTGHRSSHTASANEPTKPVMTRRGRKQAAKGNVTATNDVVVKGALHLNKKGNSDVTETVQESLTVKKGRSTSTATTSRTRHGTGAQRPPKSMNLTCQHDTADLNAAASLGKKRHGLDMIEKEEMRVDPLCPLVLPVQSGYYDVLDTDEEAEWTSSSEEDIAANKEDNHGSEAIPAVQSLSDAESGQLVHPSLSGEEQRKSDKAATLQSDVEANSTESSSKETQSDGMKAPISEMQCESDANPIDLVPQSASNDQRGREAHSDQNEVVLSAPEDCSPVLKVMDVKAKDYVFDIDTDPEAEWTSSEEEKEKEKEKEEEEEEEEEDEEEEEKEENEEMEEKEEAEVEEGKAIEEKVEEEETEEKVEKEEEDEEVEEEKEEKEEEEEGQIAKHIGVVPGANSSHLAQLNVVSVNTKTSLNRSGKCTSVTDLFSKDTAEPVEATGISADVLVKETQDLDIIPETQLLFDAHDDQADEEAEALRGGSPEIPLIGSQLPVVLRLNTTALTSAALHEISDGHSTELETQSGAQIQMPVSRFKQVQSCSTDDSSCARMSKKRKRKRMKVSRKKKASTESVTGMSDSIVVANFSTESPCASLHSCDFPSKKNSDYNGEDVAACVKQTQDKVEKTTESDNDSRVTTRSMSTKMSGLQSQFNGSAVANGVQDVYSDRHQQQSLLTSEHVDCSQDVSTIGVTSDSSDIDVEHCSNGTRTDRSVLDHQRLEQKQLSRNKHRLSKPMPPLSVPSTGALKVVQDPTSECKVDKQPAPSSKLQTTKAAKQSSRLKEGNKEKRVDYAQPSVSASKLSVPSSVLPKQGTHAMKSVTDSRAITRRHVVTTAVDVSRKRQVLSTTASPDESTDSSDEDPLNISGTKPIHHPQKKSSLSVLLNDGGRKKGSRQNIPSISQTPPSQRRFSSEASVKLFSLTPGIRGKKLATVRTVHGATPLRKKPKLSKPKHSAELNLSTLSQAEVEYSKNASQNLSALLDADDMLWDS